MGRVPGHRTHLIDREHAVRTALAIIDEEGLGAFSLEKLAGRLGVKGPSLYHHFADRASLLARVARIILSEVPDAWSEENMLAWDEGLLGMALELRRAILRHPNAGPLLLEHFPRELVLPQYERTVAALEVAGIPDRYHVLIFEGIEKLTIGFALSQARARRPSAPVFPAVDRDELPALSRAVEANARDDESLLVGACVAFLRGIAALVALDNEADGEPTLSLTSADSGPAPLQRA
jgi:AcrR family transcriptional regulator